MWYAVICHLLCQRPGLEWPDLLVIRVLVQEPRASLRTLLVPDQADQGIKCLTSALTIANLCRLKRLNAMKTGSMPGMSVTIPILGVSVSVLCPNYSQDQRQWPRCVSRKVSSSPWLPVWRNAGPFVQRRPSECSSPQLLIYLLSTYFQCKNVDIFAMYN